MESGKVATRLLDLQSHFDACLASFDKTASRYHKQVYQVKRNELNSKLTSCFDSLIQLQLRNLHKHIMTRFTEQLKSVKDMKNVKLVFENSVKEYDSLVNESLLKDMECPLNEFKNQLLNELNELMSLKKKEALQLISLEMEKHILDSLDEPLVILLNEFDSKDVWNRIQSLYKSQSNEFLSLYKSKLSDFELSHQDLSDSLDQFKVLIWNKLIELIKSNTQDVHMMDRLRSCFESLFKYDEKGIPRVWKAGQDVESIFTRAKESTEKAFENWSRMKFQVSELDPHVVSVNVSCFIL